MLILTGALAAFFIWTVFNSLFLPSLPAAAETPGKPLVSVLVPMRNEERNIETLVAAL